MQKYLCKTGTKINVWTYNYEITLKSQQYKKFLCLYKQTNVLCFVFCFVCGMFFVLCVCFLFCVF